MPLEACITSAKKPNLNVNLTISSGENVATQLAISIDGEPYDISGLRVKMQISFPNALFLTTENGGIALNNPTQGKFMIIMSDFLTEGFPVGGFPYDVYLLNNDGSNVLRVISGLFNVLQSIVSIP